MDEPIAMLLARLRAAERPELLKLLTKAISHLTIVGRSHYDDSEPAGPLREVNESIHRLSGYLYELHDGTVAFHENLAAGVGATLKLLPPVLITHLCELRT
jgi:hypothetical protein